MLRHIILIFLLFIGVFSLGQEEAREQTLSLLFIGDIMGHDAQIKAAYDKENNTYDYTPVFNKVAPIIKKADFAIANLEVTLAGKPYKGYPQFSSPDALAEACLEAGIDVLLTANNHSCDRGKKGILRTINVLDSLQIAHTGTFKDSIERKKNNLLILKKNDISVGILNYTYGTNGIPAPLPTLVNRIDTALIAKDIAHAKTKKLDKIIVLTHWGIEYKRYPSAAQKQLAKFLFEQGVDAVIGSHPHVVQPLEYHPETEVQKERFIAYSLGNFVSNQRAKTKDGGIMAALTFEKKAGKVFLKDKGYHLTWVRRVVSSHGKYFFEILPCATVEANEFEGLDDFSKNKMRYFISDTRKLFENVNIAVPEIK